MKNLLLENARVSGIEVFYDGVRYLWDNGRDFIPMDSRSLTKQLEMRGIRPADNFIAAVQTDRYIKYAGPLAGRQRGVHESNGDLLLATVSPRLIKSSPGPFPTIRGFIADLLGGDEHQERQIEAFFGWMQTARRSMLEGTRRPGQALVLAGPVACGKTQLIKQVITPSMGGRDARPYKYLSGANAFNADLIGAEVLIIDDETAATRIEKRRALGDGIKNALFASSVRIEGKFKNAFDFDPLWRLVIAVNDEPESLLVLPPLAADLSDKLMLLKCQKAIEMDDAQFNQWRKDVAEEMPAFLHAVENFQIKPENIDGRCGVKSFYHPDVVAAISELSPEHQLRSLVDVLEASGGISLPWEGSAALLRALLTAPHAVTRTDADKLIGAHAVNCGRYLGRLIGKGVERLSVVDDRLEHQRMHAAAVQAETAAREAALLKAGDDPELVKARQALEKFEAKLNPDVAPFRGSVKLKSEHVLDML